METYCILCEIRNEEEETVDDLQVATKTDCSYEVQPRTEERIDNLNKIIEHDLISTCCAEQNSLTKVGRNL